MFLGLFNDFSIIILIFYDFVFLLIFMNFFKEKEDKNDKLNTQEEEEIRN